MHASSGLLKYLAISPLGVICLTIVIGAFLISLFYLVRDILTGMLIRINSHLAAADRHPSSPH